MADDFESLRKQIGLAALRSDPFPTNDRGSLVAPDYVAKERDRLREHLREAKPEFMTDGFGLRGRKAPTVVETTDFGTIAGRWKSSVTVEPKRGFWPPDQSSTTQQVTQQQSINVSFLLQDATTTDEDGNESNRVRVFSGRIDYDFPSGMPSDNYILDLEHPEESIVYAHATFNPTDLSITSRSLGVWKPADGDFPESRVEDATHGFLYWRIGFTYFDANGTFTIWNQRLGDIYLAPSYGADNGKPALWIDSEIGWLDLDALFP